MLKVVNDLPEDYTFTDDLIVNSSEYFKNANQSTILAIDEKVVGCATMCYIEMMPTFSHPRKESTFDECIYKQPIP